MKNRNKLHETVLISTAFAVFLCLLIFIWHETHQEKNQESWHAPSVKLDLPRVMVVDGTVSQTIVKPIDFKICNVVIDIFDHEQALTFTDAETGNRVTVFGSYAFIGYSEKDCVIRDWRKKKDANAINATSK